MKTVSTSERLRYEFDKTMARGPVALIGWLALLSISFILVAAVIVTVFKLHQDDGARIPFTDAAWMSLMRTLDSGTMGGDTGWSFRFIMFLVTLAGIFVVSSLIGVLTTMIEAKMDELRKGRSFVIEKDHTLILGWSPSVFAIVSELVIANANQKKPRIVVMSPRDKVEMEDEIRERVGSTGRTKVICRTGSPIDLSDLEIVNPHQAKSIIILAGDEEDPDPQVIKTILAITNNPNRRSEPYHIVSEIQEKKNLEVARMVGKSEAQLVLVDSLIARITVQACRQSGISVVFTELLDFDGDEIYFQEEPKLIGKTFGESLSAYEKCAVIGLQMADGQVRVNPPMDTPISKGDKMIAIAGDDDEVVLSSGINVTVNASGIHHSDPKTSTPESTLIIGWNRRGYDIIDELDSYVYPGSRTHIVAMTEAEAEMQAMCDTPGRAQVITYQQSDTSDRVVLDALDLPSYDHVIVLGYTDSMGIQEADAKTLITLLHLRHIAEIGGHDFSIVSEIVDIRNRELASVTKVDDFIVSDKLISLMLAQISENPSLIAVLEDIFDADGSEIYLKPATEYVNVGVPLNFYTVTESARQLGHCAIGYKQDAFEGDASKAFGVVVNPAKSEMVTFTDRDKIIVLSES